ncbi:hypothetical protein HDU98_008664 [Podochytrium sp. JEL0797]|nr:hypothetical protein HDU98_008664 [Podochytrium sp. JEL0797]
MTITTILFIQDGKTSQDKQCVVESGNLLRGHIYVSLGRTVRGIKVSMKLHGQWECVWRPRPSVYDKDGGIVGGPAVEGTMEATKTVTHVMQDVYEGTLLRGEHGMPGVLHVPVSAPPSLQTPPRTEKIANLSAPVPMHARCFYHLIVTATSLENGGDEKSFVIPVTVMAASGLRAAVMRNQPRPLHFSNAARLAVPCSIFSDAPRTSPFSFPRQDPLDPILRTLNPPCEVVPIFDKEQLLYDLDVPRLHHFIGDTIPFTMAMKPKPPLSTSSKVYSVTASLIAHVHFQLPPKLFPSQLPPSPAIAIRLHTETYPWEMPTPDQQTDLSDSQHPRRFHFCLLPETIPCPSLPDTAQNTLPVEILHMLRISVRVSNFGTEVEKLDQPQPPSAVRLSDLDVLVLDIPVVLVQKGCHIHQWGIPRVPRGWRVGQMVEEIAKSMPVNARRGSDVVVSASGVLVEERDESPAVSVVGTKTPPSTPQRKSWFFGGGGKPGSEAKKPKHPKFTAEELKMMAVEAMNGGDVGGVIAVAEGGSGGETPPQKSVDTPPQAESGRASNASVTEPEASAAEVPDQPVVVVSAPEAGGDDVSSQIAVENAGLSERRPSAGSLAVVSEADSERPVSPQWEIEHRPDSPTDHISAVEQEGSRTAPSADLPPSPPATKTPPTPDFHSKETVDTMETSVKRVKQAPEAKKVDQMKKQLAHGLDEKGRFLPLTEFSGRYRALYPYMEDLRPDEIKLSVGDLVDVHVSYVDGWAKATNSSTREEGFVPLHCLVSQENAVVEDGRALGKWFDTSISHQVEVPNDWKYLCHHETRYNLMKGMLTQYKPMMGAAAGLEMPSAAHIGIAQKRITSSWIENERCFRCYSSAAPEVWEK